MAQCDRFSQPVMRRTRTTSNHSSLGGTVGSARGTFSSGFGTPTNAGTPTSSRGCPRQALRAPVRASGIRGALAQTAGAGVQSSAPDAEVEKEFGGRFLPEYTKKYLLGRGACGAVWLATSARLGGSVAVKQVAKGTSQKQNSDLRSANKEIRVGEMLFCQGGVPRLSATAFPGIRHITKLLDVAETKSDIFLVMEYGGAVLSKALFDIKGEFCSRGSFQPRERVYRVHHLPFYEAMKRDQRVLKRLLRQILMAIHALSEHSIVHSDLKPDNLLLNVEEGQELACDLRLCDFGSSFLADRPGEQLALATPEYMPPEALKSCIPGHNDGNEAGIQTRSQPWSFDVWSLGAIMLELCYGVPHWLSYKCRVRGADGVKDHSVTGLFAVAGRDHERILQRQQELVLEGGLHKALRDAPGIALEPAGFELLEAMLAWDPEHRISPAEALRHPYLAGN
mmetsp:Transcript_170921/g.547791  ORF Transcript_170921/g.547791 Transcript_170921/m.547791 type:complete len:452 (+) Transcript_170921:106-1461(+)